MSGGGGPYRIAGRRLEEYAAKRKLERAAKLRLVK